MNNEYYWSLLLSPGWVQAAVWTIEDKTTKVLSASKALPWEEESDLVEATNAALSSAVEELPEMEEPTKTVFGVPPSWVSEGQINKEHIGKIKLICSKLSLSPSGFVVLPEAIAHAIKVEEGTPLNGVIIGIGKELIDITLFKLGNLVGTINVAKSVSIVGDVVEGLTRFAGADHLPSRFLIYEGKEAELEDAKQALLEYDWLESEKIKFLHTPQIEIIDNKKKALSISLAGASEITEVNSVIFEEEKKDEISEIIDEGHQNVIEETSVAPEDVGFVLGEDVKNMPHEDRFVIHGQEDEPQVHTENHQHKEKSLNLSFLKSVNLPHFNNPLKSLKKPTPKPAHTLPISHVPGTSTQYKLYGIFGSVLVVLIALIATWLIYPKANVTIYVSPRTLEEKDTLTVTKNGQLDVSTKTVPGVAQTVTVNGEKSQTATGKKVVGDKAKGKLTIRNGTSNGIKLASGSVLTGPNDLRFVIDEAASVSGAISPSSPGSVTLNATAESIGSEYNLTKGEILKVSNYPKSEVDAVIDENFSGGSSREVVVVSKDDIEDLQKALTDELTGQAKTLLKAEVTMDQVFVDEAISVGESEKNFSHKAGDEADSVSLSMEMTVSGIMVEKSLLYEVGKSNLESKVPEGFSLRPEQVDMKFDLEEEKDDEWVVKTTYVANLLPGVDDDLVKKKVVGKSIASAEKYLSTIPSFSRAEIDFKPAFFKTFKRLPPLSKNITIEVGADR